MLKTLAAVLVSALIGAQSVSELPRSIEPLEEIAIAEMIAAEGEGYPVICKVALAALVLNRVDSELYPDDVLSVLADRGAFPKYESRSRAYTEDEINGALRYVYAAEYGFDPSFGALCYSADPDSPIIPSMCAGGMKFGDLD